MAKVGLPVWEPGVWADTVWAAGLWASVSNAKTDSESWRHTTLTIPSSKEVSEELNLEDRPNRRAKRLTFIPPAGLTETVTIQLGNATGGHYRPLVDDAGANVNVATAKAKSISKVSAGSVRLTSATAVGADRVFRVEGD